jgi:hypothetical protein
MTRRLRGATTIEFALVLIVFLMFLLGVVEFSRMLYTWNAAAQAARIGARYAVICETGDGLFEEEVLKRMQGWLPQVSAIALQWTPESCGPGNCESVTVTITGLAYQWLAPVPDSFSRVLPVPDFATTLTRESMRQDPVSSAKACS